ncbi:DUF551 domain-containing protein [Citrobacter freundii]
MTTNNHPAQGPVSLDRLHQISEILSKAAAQSDGGNLGYAMADAVKVINGVIAAFGAEPVAVNDDMAYTFHHALSDSSLGADEVEEIKIGLRAAFANIAAQQPAPVVPLPDVVSVLLNHLEDVLPDDAFNLIDVKAWNAVSMLTCPDACRAAMLQAGNSPVTPDGWVSVSERMPEESGRYWCYVEEQNSLGKSHYQWNCSWNGEAWSDKALSGRVTHWMPLPAAPQQEVK